MSGMEILAAVTCLFLGYWIASAILERKPERPEDSEPKEHPAREESAGTKSGDDNMPKI